MMFDLSLPNSPPMQCPIRKEFIQRILPRLSILQDLEENPQGEINFQQMLIGCSTVLKCVANYKGFETIK